MYNKIKIDDATTTILQGHYSTHDDILLKGYFRCNKTNAAIKRKQNIYFIAAFILLYCT